MTQARRGQQPGLPQATGGRNTATLLVFDNARIAAPGRAVKLVGGRLLPGPHGGAAAFFMYESKTGERFTLYSTRANGPDTSLRYHAQGRLTELSWADSDIAYVVSGEANPDRLHKVAETVYAQLARPLR